MTKYRKLIEIWTDNVNEVFIIESNFNIDIRC